jgi:hypothetical protein
MTREELEELRFMAQVAAAPGKGDQFTAYDFHECLNHEGVSLTSPIEEVIAANGSYSDGNEWSGNFIVKLGNGQFALISGGCDYTGWG